MTTKRDAWENGLQHQLASGIVLCGCQKEWTGQPAGQDRKWKAGLPGRETGTLGTGERKAFSPGDTEECWEDS